MVSRRFYLRMGQRCFICLKSIWFFQKWYSTYDNYIYHDKCRIYWRNIKRARKDMR